MNRAQRREQRMARMDAALARERIRMTGSVVETVHPLTAFRAGYEAAGGPSLPQEEIVVLYARWLHTEDDS